MQRVLLAEREVGEHAPPAHSIWYKWQTYFLGLQSQLYDTHLFQFAFGTASSQFIARQHKQRQRAPREREIYKTGMCVFFPLSMQRPFVIYNTQRQTANLNYLLYLASSPFFAQPGARKGFGWRTLFARWETRSGNLFCFLQNIVNNFTLGSNKNLF